MTAVKIEGKRKSEIREILKAFNSKTVRREIIDTIRDLRKVPEKEARDAKTLFPSEVEAVLKKFA